MPPVIIIITIITIIIIIIIIIFVIFVVLPLTGWNSGRNRDLSFEIREALKFSLTDEAWIQRKTLYYRGINDVSTSFTW